MSLTHNWRPFLTMMASAKARALPAHTLHSCSLSGTCFTCFTYFKISDCTSLLKFQGTSVPGLPARLDDTVPSADRSTKRGAYETHSLSHRPVTGRLWWKQVRFSIPDHWSLRKYILPPYSRTMLYGLSCTITSSCVWLLGADDWIYKTSWEEKCVE